MQYPFGSLRRVFAIATSFLLFSSVYAQEKNEWSVSLQKEYTKSYPVGSNMVSLQNKYGKMNIETWDKNEVQVEARISIGAQDREFAQKMLDRISVEDESKEGAIRFRTTVDNTTMDESGNDAGSKMRTYEMRIDWVVHLPATATLYAENRFGPITIGDYRGVVELQCKYGTVTAGKLSNRKVIHVEFGKADIKEMSDSTGLVFKYSKVEIGKLSGVARAEFQYCSSIDLPVDNSLKEVEIKNNYTSLYLLTSGDFSADYDITTNNSSATGKNHIAIQEVKTGAPNSSNRTVYYSPSHRYSGSIGKGGGTKMMIKSNFGNIRII